MILTDKDRVNIIHAYQVDLIPIVKLAKQYGITRHGIYKMLKAVGIDTSKTTNSIIKVSCTVCGEETTRLRCQIRKSNHHFCSHKCYEAWLKHGNGNPLIMHRQSSRMARKVVEKHYPLRESQIVHHEDRNQYNNQLNNLKVFVNQGDHIRYHRGFEVPILWDGSIK